jgi:hypothetical protein
MSTRTSQRQLLALKLDALSDTEVQELLEYVTIMESIRSRVAPTWDDTVEFLAEAQENRRARQAFEWEQARRRAERRVGVTQFHKT